MASAFSIRKILKDASYLWKASRSSGLDKNTAIANFDCCHCYKQLLQLSGARKDPKKLLFADETLFTLEEIPAMIWALQGLPGRVSGNDG